MLTPGVAVCHQVVIKKIAATVTAKIDLKNSRFSLKPPLHIVRARPGSRLSVLADGLTATGNRTTG